MPIRKVWEHEFGEYRAPRDVFSMPPIEINNEKGAALYHPRIGKRIWGAGLSGFWTSSCMDILCTTHDNRWNCLKDCDRKERTQNAVKDKFMGRRGRKKRRFRDDLIMHVTPRSCSEAQICSTRSTSEHWRFGAHFLGSHDLVSKNPVRPDWPQFRAFRIVDISRAVEGIAF